MCGSFLLCNLWNHTAVLLYNVDPFFSPDVSSILKVFTLKDIKANL